MPKPAHKRDIEDPLKKGWSIVSIPAGETESALFPLDSDHDVHLFWQVFDIDGKKLEGRNRPHAFVVENDDGGVAKIVLREPAPETVTILYKIIETEDDEETPI